MKFLILLFALISFVLNGPTLIPVEDAFVEIRKNILECIAKDDKISDELKKYVNDNLNNGYKETLNFSKFRENEFDNTVIRLCRRKATIFTSRKRIKPLSIPKEQIKPKINN